MRFFDAVMMLVLWLAPTVLTIAGAAAWTAYRNGHDGTDRDFPEWTLLTIAWPVGAVLAAVYGLIFLVPRAIGARLGNRRAPDRTTSCATDSQQPGLGPHRSPPPRCALCGQVIK